MSKLHLFQLLTLNLSVDTLGIDLIDLIYNGVIIEDLFFGLYDVLALGALGRDQEGVSDIGDKHIVSFDPLSQPHLC